MSDNQNAINACKRKLDDKFRKIFAGVGIVMGNQLILGSPVDTGRFRANWQFAVNYPKKDILNSFSANEPATDFKNVLLTDILFITNNLPYARRLAEGYSGQAPAGWVDVILANGQKVLKDAIEEAKR